MRVLITGGAGFIGSHLAERLLDAGGWVTVIDDLSTGSLANVDHLKPRPRFVCMIDSIFNKAVLAEAIGRCDAVVHLAAAVGVRLIVESPVHTIENNIHGTEMVLRQAAKQRKGVLLASTSEVYGKRTVVPFREDADMLLGSPHQHRWAYACSKAIDEFLALAYWKERQLPVVVARLFNTVGPRQTGRYGMVLPTFVRQALVGEPLTVFGDGLQKRSFVDVSDVVEALAGLLGEPQAVGGVFNIGNPEEITIWDLAERVKAAAGSTSPIVRVPYEEAYAAGFDDIPRRLPDIGKIRNLLGWRPRRKLTDILERVIAHARAQSW